MHTHHSHFRRAQWRVLVAVMICYLFYYTGRHALGFAIPGISAELGMSKELLGWASAGMLWAYALGQVFSGGAGDRIGGRRMMTAGALLSFALNWVTSFATGFVTLFAGWSLNGLAQSMGWAPGTRLVANWWGPRERGFAFGLFSLAAGFASVLAFGASIFVIDGLGLNWRWLFRLPVLLMPLGALAVWRMSRDHPADLGFENLEDEAPPENVRATLKSAGDGAPPWRRYLAILGNRELLLASLAIGFQNAVRFALLIWVPVYFLDGDGSGGGGVWASLGLPAGMALGAFASGWVSDRFFGSRKSGVIVIFMTVAAILAVVQYLLPFGHWAALPILLFLGFFGCGSQSAFWAMAPDLLGRANTSTAIGIMDFFAYLIAGLCGPLIGWLVQHDPVANSGGENTSLVFLFVALLSACGAAVGFLIKR
ncbi:MFS transporter [Ereboglobus luteus]|uniref:MFS transporter n=1 Tax=Ereboglobus luteus TaxID=1796921 RepID=A0A2U8E7S0_9BACT|nr:MFS transporter [Ereboglobus luteus]AWI10662.1 MFS transporter [Ereboglobus luteus]